MTFPGVLPRPAMQCCFVVWSRERLKIILKLTDRVGWVRRTDAQRHTFTDKDTNKHALKRNNIHSMVCQYYKSDTCSQQNSHETMGVMCRHVCSFCFTSSDKSFQHIENNCKNKQKTKNTSKLGCRSPIRLSFCF